MDFAILNARPLFFDGATGTMLQKYGLPVGKLGEAFNIERPNTVLRLHKSYLRAGADIIKTNTFSANRFKAEAIGYPIADVVKAAVGVAKQAIDESGKKGYIALDIGPLGKIIKPFGELDYEEAIDCFKETISAGCDDADLILIETMSDLREIKAAVIAAKECCNKPIFITCTFDENEKLLCGASPECFAAFAEGMGAAAIGINCGCGPEKAKALVSRLAACTSVPLIANPNAGLPETDESGATKYSMTPTEYGYAMADIIAAGAQIIGGCCGTTPDHISSAYGSCAHTAPTKLTDKGICAVTSYNKIAVIGKKPVMIGERINPTGKAKLKAALRVGDTGFVVDEALAEETAGADILDVNVGIPDIDEKLVLKNTIDAVQTACRLPLQIDTADMGAMEAALRSYNGLPMVNSVNGSKESLLGVLPLVKKYGGVLVALTMDEKGIPDTVEGRVKIASRIIKVAEACGIAKKNIVFDTLTMSAASGADAAAVTLGAMKEISAKFGTNTVLGISNISFGLPKRDTVTAGFLSEALSMGLSAAIMNPLSQEVRSAYLVHMALFGYDKNCERYIADCSGESCSKAADTLSEAIEKGLAERAAELATALLESKAPDAIINDDIVPALNTVGESFESGKIFLPELLTAADASDAAFSKIKEAMKQSGAKECSKGKIIIATVKGDVHDLGKNIVKALLSNYGYEVIDMGKDVAADAITEMAVRENVKLVGLSALMTTTVPAMADTVKALKEAAPDIKVMVGGAVLSPEHAERMGADFYAKDAIGAVKIADGVFAK